MSARPSTEDVRYDDIGCWVVTGHDAALAAFGHPALSSQTLDAAYAGLVPVALRPAVQDLLDVVGRWFVLLDGDPHAAARRSVAPVFAPGRIRRFEQQLTGIADTVLDAVLAAPEGDVVTGIADVVSARTMAALLGLPECEPPVLHRWATALAGFFATPYQGARVVSAQEALRDMGTMLSASAEDSLWSTLPGTDADRLAVCSLMLFGGLETTASLIGVSLWCLLANDLLDALRGPEGRAVAEAVVDQVLAKQSPLGHVARVAATDTEVGGCPVRHNDLVLISLTGADPLAPPQAPPAPGPPGARAAHLAFGHGKHYCSGAPLARTEAVVTLCRFASRVRTASVIEAVWGANRTYRGLDTLRVRWEQR